MANVLASALAGGVQGFGAGLTARAERKEKKAARMGELREGARLRHEYEMKRAEREGEIRTDIANIGASATLDVAQIRSEDSRYGVDVRAQTEADNLAERKAAREAKSVEERMKMLATEVDPDSGEEMLNTGVYQGLRAGHKKFGQMPSLQQARDWVEAGRKWPDEIKLSWDDLSERVKLRNPDIAGEELRQELIRARDALSTHGYKVPQGEPPIISTPPKGGAQAAEPPAKRSRKVPSLKGELPAGEYLKEGEDPGELEWLIRRYRHRRELEAQGATGGR